MRFSVPASSSCRRILVGLQVGIVLGNGHQAADPVVQFPAGLGLGRRPLRLKQAAARFGNSLKDLLFVRGVPLDRTDEIGDQVGAPLQLRVDLTPVGLDRLVLGNESVAIHDRNDSHKCHDTHEHQHLFHALSPHCK